jgi:predicted dithiol-disulfide oxidoreductase (DUF899 family)
MPKKARQKPKKAQHSAKNSQQKPSQSVHTVRFPGESAKYRAARNTLLKHEIELRRQIEEVAAERRALPPGGQVAADYMFEEGGDASLVRLSELFGDKPVLLLYSYMYGPKMEMPCPMCTSMLDALEGNAKAAEQMIGLGVVAKSPIGRLRSWAKNRGWGSFRLLSSANNTYNRDYHGESEDGDQLPSLNVFVRRNGKIHHFYHTEQLFASPDPNADSCHIDFIWPLWNLLDLTPGGRGELYPQLAY